LPQLQNIVRCYRGNSIANPAPQLETLRPPVAQNPDRLVTIHTVSKTGENESLSYPDYQYFTPVYFPAWPLSSRYLEVKHDR
jgi:hypothetical protein